MPRYNDGKGCCSVRYSVFRSYKMRPCLPFSFNNDRICERTSTICLDNRVAYCVNNGNIGIACQPDMPVWTKMRAS